MRIDCFLLSLWSLGFLGQVNSHPIAAKPESEHEVVQLETEEKIGREPKQLFTLLLTSALAYDVLNHYLQPTAVPPGDGGVDGGTGTATRQPLDEFVDNEIRRVVQQIVAAPEAIATRAQQLIEEVVRGQATPGTPPPAPAVTTTRALIRIMQ